MTHNSGIGSFGLMAFSRKWEISEWKYMSFAILSYTGRQLVYAFATTKGLFIKNTGSV